MLAWACAIGILGLSAPTLCSSKFFYSRNTFGRPDECSLCFEKHCLILDNAQCDYYAEADSLLPKDVEEPGGIEDAAKRKEVDELMYDLVDKELSGTMECIPYVSRYTNCNKDNVCLGCKTCACNPDGMWNCTTAPPCHNQDPPLNIDHQLLAMIMEALTDSTHPKKTKRSVSDLSEDIISTDVTDTPTTVAFVKLSDWLYAVTALDAKKSSQAVVTSTTEFSIVVPDDDPVTENAIVTTETEPASTSSGLTTTEATTEASTSADADYVAFDEVLRNIAVDIKNYNRRKPLDNTISNQTFNIDYMIMDDENTTSSTPNDHVMNFTLDYEDVTPDSTIASATKVVIDLLDTASRLGANVNNTEDYTNYNKDDDSNVFDKTNDILEYNALNIMKRDVISQENITAPDVQTTVTATLNTANTTNKNTTEENIDFDGKVLIPLNKIIAEKIKEYESLQNIKVNLLKLFKRDKEQPEDKANENYTYFSIHDIEMPTSLDINLRRANPNKYDKYMLKLKHDIFEVIRDIVSIQKYKDSEIPHDLTLLMRAMKGYVYRNQLIEKPKRTYYTGPVSFRRNTNEQPSSGCYHLSFKDCLFKIIEVIDKDTPKTNALFPLSPTSRKILRDVVKSYYTDQLDMPGLRVHDPHYNLTHYINSIGTKWKEVSSNLISSAPSASLHRMKLLHCVLTLDISKMNDALSLIEFARNRRMVSSLDNVNDDTLEKIDAGLLAIHNKVRLLIQYYDQIPKRPEINNLQAYINETTTDPFIPTTIIIPVVTRKKKTHSFIKYIRNLLKASKRDVLNFLHRDVSKSEIVKELAKKRMDEMSDKRYGEYEETMKRWQRNLEIIPRVKRSNLNQFKTRTKNIIPKYLTRKVNPRIKVNRKKVTEVKKKKKEVSKRSKTVKPKRKQNSNRGTQKHAQRHVATARSTTKPTITTTKAH